MISQGREVTASCNSTDAGSEARSTKEAKKVKQAYPEVVEGCAGLSQ